MIEPRDFIDEHLRYVGDLPFTRWATAISLYREYQRLGGQGTRTAFVRVLRCRSPVDARRSGRDALRVPWALIDDPLARGVRQWREASIFSLRGGETQRDWPSVTVLYISYREHTHPGAMYGLVLFSRELARQLGIEPKRRFGATRYPVRLK